jgi:D-glycero-D-manno-heptose 1,7-bisphosphate phosphatase
LFLDRDGVLNASVVRDGKPYPPASVREVRVPEDAPSALAKMREMGFLLVCCTNQPDVGRGTQSIDEVEAINLHLSELLGLDSVEVCYDAQDGGPRRKPEPGMLLEAADRLGIDLSRSYMIGDRWRDVEAGRRAGCVPIFIELGYRESWPVALPTHVVYSLTEAVGLIALLSHGHPQSGLEGEG